MHPSGSHRTIVALITAALLLLCQTAFATQACAHSVSVAAAGSAAPCHDTASESRTPAQEPAATSGCEVSKAVAGAVKVPVFSVDASPMFALVYYAPTAVRLSTSERSTVAAVCSSPHLTLLHCRFLK
jgi:hypothetical protein